MSACVHTHLAVWKSTVFPRRNVFTLAGCPQDVASGLNPTRDTLDNPRNRRMTIFFFSASPFLFLFRKKFSRERRRHLEANGNSWCNSNDSCAKVPEHRRSAISREMEFEKKIYTSARSILEPMLG